MPRCTTTSTTASIGACTRLAPLYARIRQITGYPPSDPTALRCSLRGRRLRQLRSEVRALRPRQKSSRNTAQRFPLHCAARRRRALRPPPTRASARPLVGLERVALVHAKGGARATMPGMDPRLTIDDIREATTRLAGEVTRTPCLPSRTLAAMAGCEVSSSSSRTCSSPPRSRSAARSTRWRSCRPRSAPTACSRSRPATMRRRSRTTRSAWASPRRS